MLVKLTPSRRMVTKQQLIFRHFRLTNGFRHFRLSTIGLAAAPRPLRSPVEDVERPRPFFIKHTLTGLFKKLDCLINTKYYFRS